MHPWLESVMEKIEGALTKNARRRGVIHSGDKIKISITVVREEVRAPTRLLPITHRHTRTGLRFIDAACPTREETKEILKISTHKKAPLREFADEKRILLEWLLVGNNNNPVFIEYRAGANPMESRIATINNRLLQAPVRGKRYRLIRNYPSDKKGYEIQLWEIEGELCPPYAPTRGKNKRK